jgi:WD40 repeat protein
MNLWDVKNGLPTLSFKARSDSRLVFSADGKMIAHSDFPDGPVIKLRAADSGKVIREIKTKMSDFLSFSPNGRLVGGVGFLKDTPTSLRKALVLYEVQTGEERFNVPDIYRRFAFSPNGEYIAAPLGFSGKDVRVWEVKTGREVKTITASRFTIYAVAYSPDGKTLAAVGYDKDVRLWDTATWTQKTLLSTTHGHFDTLTFSPDGNLLALSGSDNDGRINVWDVTEQKELYTAQDHAGGTDKVTFHPSGKLFVSVGRDSLIRFWSAKDGGLLATLVEFDNDGWVVTDPNGSFDGSSRELGSGSTG